MVTLATRLAAKANGGNAVYGDLKPGDRFMFPSRYLKRVYEKSFGGWFIRVPLVSKLGAGIVTGGTPKYRTGSGTAVIKLEGS